jgi:hypothetical protein
MDNIIFVPIGNSCSVAYQLQKLNLRTGAFPFDWVRIKKLSTIAQIIRNDFDNYGYFELIKGVDQYPILDNDQFNDSGEKKTFSAKNNYGALSFHDFSSLKSFDPQEELVEEKYTRRIKRFYNCIKSNSKIIFVRDEHQPNKLKVGEVEEFIDEINSINPNIDFQIRIVCHNKDNKHSKHMGYLEEIKKVVIINDTSEFDDWRRPNVDWKKFFYQI